MLELVVIGSEADQHWRRRLIEGNSVRLGRAPSNGWAIPWDRRISREHVDVLLDGERMYVRCLPSALNAACREGKQVTDFSILVGEEFRIGVTTVRLELALQSEPRDGEPTQKKPLDEFSDEDTKTDVQVGQHFVSAEIESLREPIEPDGLLTAPRQTTPAKKKDSTFDPELESFAKKSWVQALKIKLSGGANLSDLDSDELPPPSKPLAGAGQTVSELPLASGGRSADLPDKARKLIWERLPEDVREIIGKVASGAEADDASQDRIIDALNLISHDREFLAAIGVAKLMAEMPEEKTIPVELNGLSDNNVDSNSELTDFQLRIVGRTLLHTLFSKGLGEWSWDSERPQVLGSLLRGDNMGQWEILLNQPCHLTYVVQGSRVELVRIRGEVFQQLILVSEQFRRTVGQLSERQS